MKLGLGGFFWVVALGAGAATLWLRREPQAQATPVELSVPVGTVGSSSPASETQIEEASEAISGSLILKYPEGRPANSPPLITELATTERSPLADALGSARTSPEAEAKVVLGVLDVYRQSIGSYPAGEENRQIVNALRGANRELLPFLPGDHPRLNAKGELIDAWGTPFFFHLISRTAIEVRSAGADRRLFTDDDLVAGPPGPSSLGTYIPEALPEGG